MKKLVRELAVEDGTRFEDICSFETKSYIGIWNFNTDSFVVFPSFDKEFYLYVLPKCNTLQELDNAVYAITDERICGVSESSTYEFVIEDDE